MSIPDLELTAVPNSSPLLKPMPVEPVSLYLSILPPANYHADFGFGLRHGEGSCISGGIDRHTAIFDIMSRWKAVCLPILLCVSLFLISVTKLWDMIFRLCMCKGRTHHLKVLEFKSGTKTADRFDFYLQVTVKWQSKSYISDEIY